MAANAPSSDDSGKPKIQAGNIDDPGTRTSVKTKTRNSGGSKGPKKRSYDVHPRHKPRVLLYFPEDLPEGANPIALRNVLREAGERTVALVSPEEDLEERIRQGWRQRADALVTNRVSPDIARALFAKNAYASLVLLTDENPTEAFGDLNYSPSRDSLTIGFLAFDDKHRTITGEINPLDPQPFEVHDVTKFLAATYSPTMAAVSARRFSEFLDRVLSVSEERRIKMEHGELPRYYAAALYATDVYLETGAEEDEERAFEYTRQLYNKLLPQRGHPGTFLFRRKTFQTTERGFVSVGFPGKERGLKEMTDAKATIVKMDADYFNASEQQGRFPMEEIHAALRSSTSRKGYVWKELVPGPTLYHLLNMASQLVDQTKPFDRLSHREKEYRDFPTACLDTAIARIKVWEANAPEVPELKKLNLPALKDKKDDEIKKVDPKDPGEVSRKYKKNILDAMKTAAVRLQVDLSQTDLRTLEQGVDALGYTSFITKQTVVRRCDPSFLNMIFRMDEDELGNLRTDDQNEIIVDKQALDYVISRVRTGRGGIQRSKMLSYVTHVDLPHTYGAVLENLMEVLETRETGLGARAIRKYVNRNIREYKKAAIEQAADSSGDFEDKEREISEKAQNVEDSVEAMGFYRSMRKVYFNCALFGPEMHFGFKDGEMLDTPEYEDGDEHVRANIQHYFKRATYWLEERIKRKDSTTTEQQLALFRSMVDILSRFSDTSNIDYEALSVAKST